MYGVVVTNQTVTFTVIKPKPQIPQPQSLNRTEQMKWPRGRGEAEGWGGEERRGGADSGGKVKRIPDFGHRKMLANG